MTERGESQDNPRRHPAASGYAQYSQRQSHQPAGLSPGPIPFPASTPSPIAKATTPTTVFSSFLARGAKLFNKTGHGSKASSSQPHEALSSSPPQSGATRLRARNVSGPSNLRPIQDNGNNGIYSHGNHLAARSVVDLGAGRRSNSETPPMPLRSNSGDLRTLSHKAWAHSADDLGAMLNGTEDQVTRLDESSLSPEPHGEKGRKPALNLRIEAYRNNMVQNQQQRSPGIIPRDIPSPIAVRGGTHSNTPSPMNGRFPTPSHEKTQFMLSTSDSSPVIGSSPSMGTSTTHNRSNSYNVLGSVATAESSTPRHKVTTSASTANFPFSFGAKSHTPVKTKPDAGISENRRMSQVVHHSGFLNRNVGTSFPMNLSKNWKAYKAEIKGSKLYLFKPPSDRAAGVRDLFMTEHGHEPIEDAEMDSSDTSAYPGHSPSGQEPRRKRAFWGPGRHPEMVVDAHGTILAGSVESMIYELVFGATFAENNEEGWKDFCRTTLLIIPATIGSVKFEAEFVSVVDRFLRYAEDNSLERKRTRMEWLISLFSMYYYPEGLPQDLTVFVNTHQLQIFPSSGRSRRSFKLPTPAVRSSNSSSSRPSMSHATNPSYSSEVTDMPSGGTLADLRYKASMSREKLNTIDINVVAQSLELFLLKEAIYFGHQVNAQPILASLDSKTRAWAPFSDGEGQPYWLSNFIVAQLVARADGSASVSSTHARAQAITKWIRIGDHARVIGNECVWKAVLYALISKPVARLEKAWRRVDPTDRYQLEAWIRGEKMLRGPPGFQVPWLSGQSKLLHRDLESLKEQSSYDVAIMRRIFDTVQTVANSLEPCTVEEFQVDHEDVLDLFKLWEAISAKGTPHIRSLDDYTPQSLLSEPLQVGRLAQYFHQPRSQSYHLHALVPFTFPEPLPYLAFLDRSELVRMRKESFDKHGNPTPQDLQMEHLSRLKFFPSEHVRSHWTSKEGIELDDTIFRLFGGEMIVKVVKETQPGSRPASFFENGATSLSRRPSRAPSIRVKPQAASTLERKSSNARRQSMPLLNNGRSRIAPAESNTPLTSAELVVPVVVVGGTIEKLVDVLVRGLDYIMAATADDNGEMALSDRRAKGLKLDRDEYSKTWWCTYRSFLTPDAFIAMLRKLFRSTISMAIYQGNSDSLSNQHDSSTDANLRMAIFTVINEWLLDGGGLIDVLDQPELYNEIASWLHNEREHAIPPAGLRGGADHQAWREVEETRLSLIALFEGQTKRPPLKYVSAYDQGVYGNSTRSYGPNIPDPDRMSAQELIEQLDAIGAVGIRGLQAEDLVSCMEILEIQSKDKTGWILLTDLPTLSQDEMIIQNIYFHLTLVEPSPLLSDFPSTPRLINLAQPSIRAMLHCFDRARKWATAVLAQPGISLDTRHRRMELFLQALDICRHLSGKTDGVPYDAPVIRSFVETVLCTAILSPESRMFHRAWYQTALHRGVNNVECLESLLHPVINEQLSFEPGFKLTVDFGWMIERLLELISMPDTLVTATETLGTVVNFEKRRHLYTFILNIPTLATSRPSKQRAQLNNIDHTRLQNMYEWAVRVLSDSGGNAGVSQSVKDEAFRENTHTPSGPSTRKYPKPFSKVVLLQQEKNKRDRHIRERLLREKRLEQQKKEKQTAPYEKAMDVAKKQKQGKRASLNPFMRVVRPLSTAFPFGGPMGHQEVVEVKKWTLDELDFVASGKPSASIDLAGARVEERLTNVRPFVFTMETEDGAKYYLQATTKREMQKWISQLAKIGKNTSEKRRTYVGPAAGHPQENLLPAARNLGRHPTAVFSVPLDWLIEREYGSIQVGAMPKFLEACLEEVETRGFIEDGIYRISGSKLQIDRLKAELNAGSHIKFEEQDIHNICSLIKLWIREIPEGLFPGECFWLAAEAVQTRDRMQSIELMRKAVHKLPLAHFNVLRRLMEHLSVASTHEDVTRMAEKQFSLVFGQTVFTPPESEGVKAIGAGMQYGNRVVEVLLIHYHAIFEGDIDAEGDDDDDEDQADGTGGGGPGEMQFLEGLEEEDEEQSS